MTKSNIEITYVTETSLRTARRDLIDLMKKKIIKRFGSAKTGIYCLNGTVNGTVKS